MRCSFTLQNTFRLVNMEAVFKFLLEIHQKYNRNTIEIHIIHQS